MVKIAYKKRLAQRYKELVMENKMLKQQLGKYESALFSVSIFVLVVFLVCCFTGCRSPQYNQQHSSEASTSTHEKVENNVISILDTIKIHTTDTLLRIEYDTTIITMRDTIRIQLTDKNINTYIHTTDTIRVDTITKFVTKTEQSIITNPSWWKWLIAGLVAGVIGGVILLWVIRTKVLGGK